MRLLIGSVRSGINLESFVSPRQSSSQMILCSRGHSFDVLCVTYETTKRSFLMRCLYCTERNRFCLAYRMSSWCI